MATKANFSPSILFNEDPNNAPLANIEPGSKPCTSMKNNGAVSRSTAPELPYDSTGIIHHNNQGSPTVDDITVPFISKSSSDQTMPSPITKEYVVKISFKISNDKSSHGLVASKHVALLQAITAAFPTAVPFDNHGHKVADPASITKKAAYNRRFNLHRHSHNSRTNRVPMAYVLHRLHSSVTIATICHHPAVASLLKRHNVRISHHLWTEDVTDVVNLGFHIGVDPCNQLKQQFEDHVQHQIAESTGIPIQKIPRFQCGYITPFHNNNSGRVKTRSYDIQCQKSDAAELISLLQITFFQPQPASIPPSFVFHKLRHQNASAYRNAILSQELFLQHSRVVPIQGVSESMMMYLIDDLMQLDGVKGIQYHKDTSTKGRWSIMTTKDNFRSLTTFLSDNLLEMALAYDDEDEMDPSFPFIGLAFNKKSKSPSNSSHPIATSNDTFSSQSSLLSHEKSIGTVTTAPTTSSSFTVEDFNQAMLENQRLKNQLADLSVQVQSLQQSDHLSPKIPHEIDLTALIQSTTQAVLRSIQSQTS